MFEVHYYTAGTHSYGAMIIDLLRMEIKRLYGAEILEYMRDVIS